MKNLKEKLIKLRNEIVDQEDDESYFDGDFSKLSFVLLTPQQIKLVNKIINRKKIELIIVNIIFVLMVVCMNVFGKIKGLQGYIVLIMLDCSCIIFLYQAIKKIKMKVTEETKAYNGVVLSKNRVNMRGRSSGGYVAEIKLPNNKVICASLSKIVLKQIEKGSKILLVPLSEKNIVIPS